MRICALMLALMLTGSASVAAQQASPGGRPATTVARAVDGKVLRAHLEFLADDALEGRKPGTRGGELAAKYIAAQFARLGLQPAGDSGTYYHKVPIITLTPQPTVKVGGATPSELAYRTDYVLCRCGTTRRSMPRVTSSSSVTASWHQNTSGTTTRE